MIDWAKAGRLPVIGRNKGRVWLFSARALDRVVQLTAGTD